MPGIRLALLCTSAILIASVATAQDPYSEFRIPEARSFSSLVNARAQWSSSDGGTSGFHSEIRNAFGDLSAFARWHTESEPHTSDLFVNAGGDWNSTSDQSAYFGNASSSDRDVTRYSATVRAATTRYWGASAWGFDALAVASYSYDRAGLSGSSNTAVGGTGSINTSGDVFHRYRGSADLVLGPGYGRVRDVTGVFDMQVLEERLEATGRLVHPLSASTRQRLAELFSVSGEFLAAHDRPDRFFWREVERVLREDGAIEAGSFDAWSLMRALEPATLSVAITRRAGWRVTPGYELLLNRGHTDTDAYNTTEVYLGGILVGSSASQGSFRNDLDQSSGFATLDASVHRPFGMRWQADIAGAFRYGDGPNRQLLASSDLGLSYIVADRWLATGAFTSVTTSYYHEGTRFSPAWAVRASGQLSYFFEDRWSAFVGVDQQQDRAQVFFNDTPESPAGFQRQTQVQVGLTYRPAGRFEARGLGVAERVTPGGI